MQQSAPAYLRSLVAEVREGFPCRWELMKFRREGCRGQWFPLQIVVDKWLAVQMAFVTAVGFVFYFILGPDCSQLIVWN